MFKQVGKLTSLLLLLTLSFVYTDKVFSSVKENDPIMQEKIKNRCCFGELGHPADREEVDIEKVAIVMPQPPKKNSEGLLIGYWDILDTPCGRVLLTLCNYGYKVGISTRGSGDTYLDSNGEECVDPNSYSLSAMDIVIIPAVQAARLNYVTESYHGKTLSESLREQINSATEAERKAMTETLKDLDIDITSASSSQEIESSDDNIEKINVESEASDTGAEVDNDFQQIVLENKELRDTVVKLRESLSVSYTKELKLQEELEHYKRSTILLSKQSKASQALKQRVEALTEEVNNKSKTILSQQEKIKTLTQESSAVVQSKKSLQEGIQNRESTISKLTATIDGLNNQIKQDTDSHRRKVSQLKESIEELKKDSAIKNENYSTKLGQSNKLVEKYQNIAKKAVSKYIDLQALRLGVSSREIVNKLSENYSFDEIDQVCEDLKSYKLNMTTLPFDTLSRSASSSWKIKATESKETILPSSLNTTVDDTVDDQLKIFM